SAPADAKLCSKASCASLCIFVIRRCMFLLSLTATCQVCTVSLKAGLSTYNRFARGALDPPDREATQPNTGIVGVAGGGGPPAAPRPLGGGRNRARNEKAAR